VSTAKGVPDAAVSTVESMTDAVVEAAVESTADVKKNVCVTRKEDCVAGVAVEAEEDAEVEADMSSRGWYEIQSSAP
jgi:hypothetical protein